MCWDLASCQISLNPVQQFQRRSQKCLSRSWAMAAICFTNRPEKHRLGKGRWDLASCQVSSNSVQRFQRRSRKCLSQSEAGAAILFFRSAQKHKLVRRRWNLDSCQVLWNSLQRFQRRIRKCLSQSEARAAILLFPSAKKNINLVEDIEISFPVKFCWIPFSGFREDVKNISANQRIELTIRSTIKLRDYWTMTFLKGNYHLHPITENRYNSIFLIT